MIEFDWHLTDLCNFSCTYCFPQLAKKRNRPLPHDLNSKQIADIFNSLDDIVHLSISGGEPFLFPNFVEFCEDFTKDKNEITVYTNLTQRKEIKKFADTINPTKVRKLFVAEHIIEREKRNYSVDSFIEDYILLESQGFNVGVVYVLYPPLFKRFEEDIENLSRNNIKKISIKIFKGKFKDKFYPDSYTNKEKVIIDSLKGNDYEFNKEYLHKSLNVFGKKCLAGFKSFKIEVDGKVRRCAFTDETYGNIYNEVFTPGKEPMTCPRNEAYSLTWCGKQIIET